LATSPWRIYSKLYKLKNKLIIKEGFSKKKF